jgi:hypothetical protein
MHHRKDENIVCLNTVEDAVGKTIGETTAHVIFQNRPRGRIVRDVLNRGKYLE